MTDYISFKNERKRKYLALKKNRTRSEASETFHQ